MSPEPRPPDAPSILRAEGCAAGRGWRGCARCAGGGSRARASTPAAAPPRAPAPAPAPAIPAAPPRAQGATSGSEAPMAPGGEVTPRHVTGGRPAPSRRQGAGRAAPLATAGERGCVARRVVRAGCGPRTGLRPDPTLGCKPGVSGLGGSGRGFRECEVCRWPGPSPWNTPPHTRRRRGRGSTAVPARRPQYGLRLFQAPSPAW